MNLADFAQKFQACSTSENLCALLEKHQQELTLALFAADVSVPTGLQDVVRCFYAFKLCTAFEELESNEQFPDTVIQALILFATAFERAGSFALVTPIRAILPHNSSISLRFRAQELIHGLLDIRRGYVAIFPTVMDLLKQAQFEGEGDYTAYVVQVAYAFLKTGREQLGQYDFETERSVFSTLFQDPQNLLAYPFLTHPSLTSILTGESGGSLVVRPPAPGQADVVLFPTPFIQSIFRRTFLDPVHNDARSRGFAAPLGYPKDAIRAQILEYGRADFRQPCLTVTPPAVPADKVLLYCYYNLRKHFFTTRFVLSQVIDSLPALLPGPTALPVFIDLGCGPMTSALALADLYRDRYKQPLPIHYVGIDIAPAMLEKAKTYEDSGLFTLNSRFAYYTSWNEALNPLVEQFIQVTNPVFINASYLFASGSLNVQELVLFTNELRRRCPAAKMYFLFQNPNRTDRNLKYFAWKEGLNFVHSLAQGTQLVNYQTSTYSAPSAEEVTYELLAFQSE